MVFSSLRFLLKSMLRSLILFLISFIFSCFSSSRCKPKLKRRTANFQFNLVFKLDKFSVTIWRRQNENSHHYVSPVLSIFPSISLPLPELNCLNFSAQLADCWKHPVAYWNLEYSQKSSWHNGTASVTLVNTMADIRSDMWCMKSWLLKLSHFISSVQFFRVTPTTRDVFNFAFLLQCLFHAFDMNVLKCIVTSRPIYSKS